jgi:hypothetical protein
VKLLRHTAATWLTRSGTNRWQAAGFHGMSVERTLERYGRRHPEWRATSFRNRGRLRSESANKTLVTRGKPIDRPPLGGLAP